MLEKIYDVASQVAFIVYRIEGLSKVKTSKKMIKNFIELEKKMSRFPAELEFMERFYDEKTGSSGSLFQNNIEENYILAFTGTNFYFDLVKDMYADVVGICLGQGEHYPPCYKFYKKMVKKYGDNIILTGHSLGGNIAMRVALEYNVKETIVYNAAPLYLKNGVELFMDKEVDEELYTKRLAKYKRNVNKIEKLKAIFTGSVKRIVSERDIFTRVANLLEIGDYVGDEYIIRDAGMHGIKSFLGEHQQVLNEIFINAEANNENIVTEYKDFSLEEVKLLQVLSKDILTSLEMQLNSTLQSETVVSNLNKNPYGVNFERFIAMLTEKIEEQKKDKK